MCVCGGFVCDILRQKYMVLPGIGKDKLKDGECWYLENRQDSGHSRTVLAILSARGNRAYLGLGKE